MSAKVGSTARFPSPLFLTYILRYKSSNKHIRRLHSRQDIHIAKNIAIGKPSHETEVFGTRMVHLAHDAARQLAVDLLEKGLAANQDLRDRDVMHVVGPSSRRGASRFVNEMVRCDLLEFKEGVYSLHYPVSQGVNLEKLIGIGDKPLVSQIRRML